MCLRVLRGSLSFSIYLIDSSCTSWLEVFIMNHASCYLSLGAFIMHLVSCIFLIFLIGCYPNPPAPGEFPDFITANEDYFVTRIGSVPDIDQETYELNIIGLVENPRSFTLEELRDLELIELPLTVECIGNSRNGSLVSTAVWKGFNLYDFLDALGLDEQATGVRYLAADGYYASHTLEQIQDHQVMGALL